VGVGGNWTSLGKQIWKTKKEMDLVRVNSEDVEVDGSVKDFVQW
jgi:hypothetical protein